jgi:hypothetical protein
MKILYTQTLIKSLLKVSNNQLLIDEFILHLAVEGNVVLGLYEKDIPTLIEDFKEFIEK